MGSWSTGGWRERESVQRRGQNDARFRVPMRKQDGLVAPEDVIEAFCRRQRRAALHRKPESWRGMQLRNAAMTLLDWLFVIFALLGVPLILGAALVSMFRSMATRPLPERQDDYLQESRGRLDRRQSPGFRRQLHPPQPITAVAGAREPPGHPPETAGGGEDVLMFAEFAAVVLWVLAGLIMALAAALVAGGGGVRAPSPPPPGLVKPPPPPPPPRKR